MTKKSAKDAIILIGGYNLSTYFTSYEVTQTAGAIDVTGFGDGAVNHIPGMFGATITGNVLWDNVTAKSTPAMISYAGTTTDGSITILPEGGTAGYPSLSLPFTQGGITVSGSPAGSIGLGSINFSAYGDFEGVEDGVVLHHGAVTDSTTDAGVLDPDHDDAITARCAGTLHIWTACAADTYVVKIQDSPDNITYNDLVTFTLTGAAIGSERVAVASGTIDKYQRVVAARTGSAGDSFGFSVHFWHEPLVTT